MEFKKKIIKVKMNIKKYTVERKSKNYNNFSLSNEKCNN